MFSTFQNVISGSVTTVTVDCGGGSGAGGGRGGPGGPGGPGGGDRHQEEINRLKMDKLELLRQNVSSQREVKRLRDRETQLQSDLATASREITRLRASLLDAREKLSHRATKV